MLFPSHFRWKALIAAWLGNAWKEGTSQGRWAVRTCCCCWWLHVHVSLLYLLFCSSKDRYGISCMWGKNATTGHLRIPNVDRKLGALSYMPTRLQSNCLLSGNKSAVSSGRCSWGQLKLVHATWDSRRGSNWRDWLFFGFALLKFCCGFRTQNSQFFGMWYNAA